MVITQYCPNQATCELRAEAGDIIKKELYLIELENKCYCNVLERLKLSQDTCFMVQQKNEYLERHPLEAPDLSGIDLSD